MARAAAAGAQAVSDELGAGDRFDLQVRPADTVRTENLLAADGPGSIAWAALGREYPRGAQLGVAATVYLQNAQPLQPGISEHYFERDLPCGYGWLFRQHIGQADQGCDFDFLEPGFGAPVPEPDIF